MPFKNEGLYLLNAINIAIKSYSSVFSGSCVPSSDLLMIKTSVLIRKDAVRRKNPFISSRVEAVYRMFGFLLATYSGRI
jgi:hypothetical protein